MINNLCNEKGSEATMKHYRLDAGSLLHDTARETGLERYLDEDLEARFHYLIGLFNEFGSIPEPAYPDAVNEVKRLVRIRLKLARDWEEHPEILEETIEQPFFVIGNARAGTTFAQSILTLDEGHRTPCYWDTRNPTPPPGLDPEADAAAHREAQQFIDFLLDKSPGLWPAHPYFDQGGYTEAEDEFLYSIDFNMAYPLHFLKVPTLPQAVPPPDPVQALQFHKTMLKQLQWQMPTRRWVGKGIIHQYLMPALLDVYPDAVCFWMHRPPEEYIASLLELLERQYKPFNGELYRVDPQQLVEQLKAGMEHFMAQPTIDDPRVHHIRFRDFVADPTAVLAPIYEKSGVTFTREYERRIRERVNDPAWRADRHGKFEYSLDKFGLDRNRLRRQFADYCERFEL
jgi:hypothetical protein